MNNESVCVCVCLLVCLFVCLCIVVIKGQLENTESGKAEMENGNRIY